MGIRNGESKKSKAAALTLCFRRNPVNTTTSFSHDDKSDMNRWPAVSRLDPKKLPRSKFLSETQHWEMSLMAPSPIPDIPSVIPFNWEEAPGKPNPHALNLISSPGLQLPPRLSLGGSGYHSGRIHNISDTDADEKETSFSRRMSFPCNARSRASVYSVSSKDDQARCEEDHEKKGFIVDLSESVVFSPRSILMSFDSHSQTSSSSPDVLVSPYLASDMPRVSPASPSLSRSVSDLAREFEPTLEESMKPAIATQESFKNLLRSLHVRIRRPNHSTKGPGTANPSSCSSFKSDSELWSPTLATYLVRFEHNEIEKILHRKMQQDHDAGYTPRPYSSPQTPSTVSEDFPELAAENSVVSHTLHVSAPVQPVEKEIKISGTPRSMHTSKSSFNQKQWFEKFRSSYSGFVSRQINPGYKKH